MSSNINDTPDIVYEFIYNSDCCESAAHTMSIHKSWDGAETAMESHKAMIKERWFKLREFDGDDDPEYWNEFTWDFDQYWGIRETKLLP